MTQRQTLKSAAGFFNAMIQRVKQEVDSKDSFEAVATNILVPLSSIIVNLVGAGGDEDDDYYSPKCAGFSSKILAKQ